MTLLAEKQALRAEARARRPHLARAIPDFAQRIADFADDLALSSQERISGYRAVGDEADPSALLQTLQSRGFELSYPRIHEKARPLWFHVPIPHERWQRGAFGIAEPRPNWPREFPTLLFVPLLAYDAHGRRLGYGGGYYDRSLADLERRQSITAIGVAFAGQEVEYVPSDAHDRRLDKVVTELGIRRFPPQ